MSDKFTVVRGCKIYAPEPMGEADILIAGGRILGIGDFAELTNLANGRFASIFDASGTIALPGFIDTHVHLLGGGGEGGFKTRTPEAALTGLTLAGVTSVVGVLGTDGVTRHPQSLIAKIRGLEEEGISAWGLLGCYRLPFDTVTGSVQGDLMMIDKFIGIGEIALSDHRSSQPPFELFAQTAADARVGAMLSGKAGIVQCHMGDGKRMLELILRAVEETEIPIEQFVPTHMNRNQELFREGLRYAQWGGRIDYTTSTTQAFLDEGEVKCSKALKTALGKDIPVEQITFSSDGQGSLPDFDGDGKLKGLTVGTSASLWPEVVDAVQSENIPLELAIRVITSNPANIYKLPGKGRIQAGNDADITFVGAADLRIRHVVAKGRTMVKDGKAVVKGTFEQDVSHP